MSARPSWSFDDISPAVRARAEASARRSGMSFSEWLNAMIGDVSAPASPRGVLDRLDPLARDMDDSSFSAASRRNDNESIASRGARLAQSEPANGLHRPVNFGAPEPGSLEAAIAEISARQFDLDARSGQDARYLVPSAKLSKLERQITQIMRHVETMPSAGAIEQSIGAFRAELAEMRRSITDAMPRRAMESLEAEIRALSERIEDSRDNGADRQALAGVERSLEEIRGTLRALTPAEQLAGYDEAIRKLTSRLDQTARTGGEDRDFIRQLEDSVASLRVIVSNVASNEALATLSDDVRTLSAKLDLFGQEERHGFVDTMQVEEAIRALSQRVDRLPSEFAATSDYGQLDRRVSSLLDRLETAPPTAFEDAGDDLDAPLRKSGGLDPELVDAIKREISDMRFNLTANDRHTQDSLDVLNSTLGHVVDRLAMIEGGLRTVATAPAPVAPPQASPIAPSIQPAQQPSYQPSLASLEVPPRPELPNPAVYLAPNSARVLQDAAASGNFRAPIAPDLPPDFPLEPGTLAGASSALDSVAEEKIDEAGEPAGDVKPNFIAAARRAARAAAASAAAQPEKTRFKKDPKKASESGVTAKIRSLLVGASVVVIVLGSFRMAMSLFESAAPNPETSSVERSIAPQSETPAPLPIAPEPGKQSSLLSIPVPQQESMAIAAATADVTGSLPAKPQASIPAGETLPESIGNARLREAALKGDAGAAYEIATRFAEGRGVLANFTEAARWYDRAAQGGVVPAMFRYGALYEKGIGVKKDLDAARRYYALAADRGNAKAMHNLAVLEADGGSAGPNFRAAGGWFRKAAERGVVDSQYNLGILYARGIGVEQNLAESYKWFSLAAAQGDTDSNSKRDDVAKKLDAQSLAAAKLATQTFLPEAQPAVATDTNAPAGGWDAAAAQSANAAPVAKAVTSRRVLPAK